MPHNLLEQNMQIKKLVQLVILGCFSAHPLKNLNALGDSGYLATNNKKIYEKIKDLSNHGMTKKYNLSIWVCFKNGYSTSSNLKF